MTPSWPHARLAVAIAFAAGLALAAARSATTVHAAVVPTDFVDELLIPGLDAPVNSTTMADGRLLFVEQYTGKVRMVVGNQLAAIDPVGTVPEVEAVGESGLIGIATDPDWPARPYVYVMANHLGSATVRLWRFRLEGDLTNAGDGAMWFDPASRYTILEDIPDNTTSHQAGSLRFDNDGKLLLAMGDDEQTCVALDVTSRLGKILRLDVSSLPDGPGGPPLYAALSPPDNPWAEHPDSVARLVWARGLRNPYMTSYDPVSSTLVIGDVGDTRWEEIDIAPGGGRNYGWPIYEGLAPTGLTCPGADTTNMTAPVYVYEHLTPGYSVFGGPIYRAPLGAPSPFPPEYEGDIFFGDTWRGYLRRLEFDGASWALAPPVLGQPDPLNWATSPKYMTSMTIAPDGSLYYFLIYRTVPSNGPGEFRRIRYVGAVGVGDDPLAASDARAPVLHAPYPAPSAGAVEFAYRLARPSSVRLVIVDTRGRTVRTLVDAHAGVLAAGPGRASWDGDDAQGRRAPAGVYFARLEAGDLHVAKRFVRLAPR